MIFPSPSCLRVRHHVLHGLRILPRHASSLSAIHRGLRDSEKARPQGYKRESLQTPRTSRNTQRSGLKITKGKKDITGKDREAKSRRARFYDPDDSFGKRSLVYQLKGDDSRGNSAGKAGRKGSSAGRRESVMTSADFLNNFNSIPDRPTARSSARSPARSPDKFADRLSDKFTDRPSGKFTDRPSARSSDRPSGRFSDRPSDKFSDRSSGRFSDRSSDKFSDRPSDKFSDRSSGKFSDRSSGRFSDRPSASSSDRPSGRFSDRPSDKFSDRSSGKFSDRSSGRFSDRPSASSSDRPSGRFSDRPSDKFSDRPSGRFTDRSSGKFSDRSSGRFSDRPSASSSDRPSGRFSDRPSDKFSDRPSGRFSDRPSGRFSDRPSDKFSDRPSGRFTDRSSARSPTQSSDKFTDRPTDRPADRSTHRLTDRPTARSPAWSTDRSLVRTTDRPTDRPTDRSMGRSADRSTTRFTDMSTDRSANRFADRSMDRSPPRPTDRPTDRSASRFTDRSMGGSPARSTDRSTAMFTDRPPAEPTQVEEGVEPRPAEGRTTSWGDGKTTFRRQPPEDESVPSRIFARTTAASMFLYGRSVVETALVHSHRKLYKLYLYAGENRTERVGPQDALIRALAERKGIKIIEVNNRALREMDKVSEGRPHNGWILEASPVPQLPLKSLGPLSDDKCGYKLVQSHQAPEDKQINGDYDFVPYQLAAGRHPFILLLDGIVDPGNLGAIIRSAAFLGVNAVAITRGHSSPITPATIKASAGASELIKLFSVPSSIDFLTRSKESGWAVFAAVPPRLSRSRGNSHLTLDLLEAYDPLSAQPTILVLGSEGDGLSKQVRRAADYEVSISNQSFQSFVDSLNVSVAAALLCSSFLKKQFPGFRIDKLTQAEGKEENNEGNEDGEDRLW